MTDLGADMEIVDEDTTTPNAYVAHSVDESNEDGKWDESSEGFGDEVDLTSAIPLEKR
jgi:hypothetical protein